MIDTPRIFRLKHAQRTKGATLSFPESRQVRYLHTDITTAQP